MASSKATSVSEYLAQLPAERRAVVSAVRDVIASHLPPGYRETINWGMISYEVPLERHPNTYNGKPLGYMALAAQKNYYSLHLMCVYCDAERDAWLRGEYSKAGKKLDMGKGCLRFKRLEDLPLDVIAALTAATPVEKFIEGYEAAVRRPAMAKGKAPKKTT